MPRYLIEGSCDGGLFAEAIDAEDEQEAERLAVKMLCEAWRVDYFPDLDLSDLGDSANVTRYSRGDYIRDESQSLFALVEQISRMSTAQEADGAEWWKDLAMDGLIGRAREIVGRIGE